MDGNKPTIEEESHFLDLRDDLASLWTETEPKSSLETFLERHCFKLFVTAVGKIQGT